MLSDAESKMIQEKKEDDSMYPNTLIIWEQTKFPHILASRRYPRGGEWQPRKKGGVKEDSSHKMAIHFEFEYTISICDHSSH